jgi:homoserine dehydrogenase
MTAISLQTLSPPREAQAPRPLRIALAGFGIVGQALAEKLAARADYEIVAILVRDPKRPRAVQPPVPLTADRKAFLDTPADILIDVLSCAETGALLSEWALGRGIHVVSASKRVVSGCLTLLRAAAGRTGAEFLYSAAVGGGAPVLETVAAARGRGEIRSVEGVLNGTVGYILTRLAAGQSYADALAQARLAGFAEEDPSEDLSGADAAAKVRLIAAEAWGLDPREVDVEAQPLDKAAVARIQSSGEPWVQLARVTRDAASVTLVPLRLAPQLPPVSGEGNCALVTLEDGSLFTCSGKGAGGDPTSASILTDLARLSAARAARLATC